MMKWLCSTCSREIEDHTLREIHAGRCSYVAPAPEAPKLTASEYGKVNPEAVEDTGEQIDLKTFQFRRGVDTTSEEHQIERWKDRQ